MRSAEERARDPWQGEDLLLRYTDCEEDLRNLDTVLEGSSIAPSVHSYLLAVGVVVHSLGEESNTNM